MESLHIKGSEESPEVMLDKASGIFRISGKSYMEDVQAFFDETLQWLETYSKSPNEHTDFEFVIEYVNTASTKIVLDILGILDKMHKQNHKIKVHWNYYEDDEDMLDLGNEMRDMFELDFEIKEIRFGQSRTMFPVE